MMSLHSELTLAKLVYNYTNTSVFCTLILRCGYFYQLMTGGTILYPCLAKAPFGTVLKEWYPQIIHGTSYGIIPHKPSILLTTTTIFFSPCLYCKKKLKQHETFLETVRTSAALQVWTRLAETANKHDTVIVLQAGPLAAA